MCGRFALHLSRDEIQAQTAAAEWIDQDNFVPRYNIAPRTQAPVLRRSQGSNAPSASDSQPSTSKLSSQDTLVLQTMKWGLIPHWSKFEDTKLNTTNARAENLVDGGGMWQSLKGRKRCAVICEGYYEWLTKGKNKLPHFTRHKGGKRLMLMAGLYDSVVLEGSDTPLWTFTIVTTAAAPEFEWLHSRQPVILSTMEALDRWLDTSSRQWDDEVAGLLGPYEQKSSPLECYQVPKEVGKVGTESSTFIEPIDKRKDGIEAMFAKQGAKRKDPPESSSRKTKMVQPVSKAEKPSKKASSQLRLSRAHVKKDESDDEIVITDGPSGPSPQKKMKK
ncbi:DUF159-domain-containing protein [Guyanagaster necrorhizus]|uniref:DUF159-domain-containing protein n=1 Tax=Guyanagaster necrorhizus TaxID=856835 RepID=A0A9P7VWA7_9AGAR|nr:DUF159-domain-containing protein [Guyanagaster necrorhizus MCA 3950]KAG7447344.1 DUF159-domain-containing protein [Guyanagaster necrorhizus MCA 3950]